MITKICTDIEQSKKLAEILPIESADMYYQYALPKSNKIRYNPVLGNPIDALEWYNKGYTHFGKSPLALNEYCIPCWSLAALLDIIPYPTLSKHADETWSCASWMEKVNQYFVEGCDSPINACYEMIIKLHEEKLL